MLDERREGHERPERLPMDSSTLTANLRLFGLLALLVPLFAGLQYVVREGVPRVEVRLVPQDVPTSVLVERVVERVVYVPVGSEAAVPPTERPEPARAILSAAPKATERTDVRVGGLPSAEVASREPEPAAPPVGAEPAPEQETPPLMGTVALAPPAPVPAAAPAAAPIVAARLAPIVPQVQVVQYADEPEAAEMVAEAEAVESETAEAAPDDGAVVAEEANGPTEEVAVIQFVSDEPVVRDDEGASIAMLRHELAVREARPVPAADEPAPLAATEEPAQSTDVEAAGEAEAAADEPGAAIGESEAEQPAADGDETVSEAGPVSSEELLSQAPTVTIEVLDHGSNNEQSLGVLEHQLVARPAGPPAAATGEDDGSGPQDHGPAAAEMADDAVRPEVAAIEAAEQAETGGGAEEVARAEEEAEVSEEPEQ